MLDKDQVIVDKLREEMAVEFQRLTDANDAKTEQVCSAMLSELWGPIHSKVGEGGVEGLEHSCENGLIGNALNNAHRGAWMGVQCSMHSLQRTC